MATICEAATNPEMRCTGTDSRWERDVQGNMLCRTCSACERVQLRRYRAGVLTDDQCDRVGLTPDHTAVYYRDY